MEEGLRIAVKVELAMKMKTGEYCNIYNPLFSHDSVLKLNSLWGRAQMKSNQIKSIHIKSNVGFSGEVKTGVPGEKPLGAEKRTNKLNPHMTPNLGIELALHWWEASALTTAPSLLPASLLPANDI